MSEIYLICDESGSKGFSDNTETFEGEFGLFAGYFLDSENFQSLKSALDAIYDKYCPPVGKLHITDLDSSAQESLRSDVFKIIKDNKIYCSYDAISVKGFNTAYVETNDIAENQKAQVKENFSFSNKSTLERLHSELFQALFAKSIAFFIDKYGEENINIKVITDNIDRKLKVEFEQRAIELISPFPSTDQLKAFDKKKGKPVVKNITFTSKELQDDKISNTKFELSVQDDSYTLIADILANSLYYYIKQEVIKNPNICLNSYDAVKEHPVADMLYGLSSVTNINSVSDAIFGRLRQ